MKPRGLVWLLALLSADGCGHRPCCNSSTVLHPLPPRKPKLPGRVIFPSPAGRPPMEGRGPRGDDPPVPRNIPDGHLSRGPGGNHSPRPPEAKKTGVCQISETPWACVSALPRRGNRNSHGDISRETGYPAGNFSGCNVCRVKEGACPIYKDSRLPQCGLHPGNLPR